MCLSKIAGVYLSIGPFKDFSLANNFEMALAMNYTG